jgi:hypothetical protein|tara:strand:- start:392 stop:538 length:147 start_codon:yes stop_codon:yes gene_type:complete
MPTMYKKGFDPIGVQKGQVGNAEIRGWSLDEKDTKKETTTKPKKEKEL